jgi:hypothetical protein
MDPEPPDGAELLQAQTNSERKTVLSILLDSKPHAFISDLFLSARSFW